MKNKLIILFLVICNILVGQEYNKWGERFFDRVSDDIIVVEHQEEQIEGYKTYSIYFSRTLREKDVMSIMYYENLLYIESSHYKVTLVVRDTKKWHIKKRIRKYARIIWGSAKNQVYYKSIYDKPLKST